jgi:hypothetical protein
MPCSTNKFASDKSHKALLQAKGVESRGCEVAL